VNADEYQMVVRVVSELLAVERERTAALEGRVRELEQARAKAKGAASTRQTADAVVEATRGFVKRLLAPLEARVAALEQRPPQP
jgi:BMFP domain-containing protein YqiC